MATYLENLQTRRNAICVELAALASTKAGGKPNNQAGGGGGAVIDHVGYKDGLYRELKEINELIANAGNEEDAFEITSQAIV